MKLSGLSIKSMLIISRDTRVKDIVSFFNCDIDLLEDLEESSYEINDADILLEVMNKSHIGTGILTREEITHLQYNNALIKTIDNEFFFINALKDDDPTVYSILLKNSKNFCNVFIAYNYLKEGHSIVYHSVPEEKEYIFFKPKIDIINEHVGRIPADEYIFCYDDKLKKTINMTPHKLRGLMSYLFERNFKILPKDYKLGDEY